MTAPPMHCRQLPLPPDPLELARRCWRVSSSSLGAPQASNRMAFLWDATGQTPSFVCMHPQATSRALDPEPQLPRGSPLRPGPSRPRWVGVLPYEAFRGLERQDPRSDTRAASTCPSAHWTRYGVCVRVDQCVSVLGEDRNQVDRAACEMLAAEPTAPAEASLLPLDREPGHRHLERIERALELIRAGEIYEVNLARRLRYVASGAPLELLARMGAHARPAFGGMVSTGSGLLLSTSPELLLEVTPDGRARTTPIKGTRPRAPDAAKDQMLAQALEADPKERAELSMTLDVERNDLGRVCEYGSVVVSDGPRVSPMGSLWHRHASVEGQLRPEVSRAELLAAMLPSGSITGAPKIRAMQVISELESARRGAYTGGFGWIDHSGCLRLGMAIRCLELCENRDRTEANYWAGGGIVLASNPPRELRETEWKARQLQSLLGEPG